jgi:Protein of unknown function (DUF1573)
MKNIVIFIVIIFTASFLHAQSVQQTDPSKNIGKVEWQWSIDMGEIKYEVPTTALFPIKNISSDTITIVNTWSGCGCTVPDPPGAKIAPGETYNLKAVYNANKVGDFYKVISVTTNLDVDNAVILSIKGKVIE